MSKPDTLRRMVERIGWALIFALTVLWWAVAVPAAAGITAWRTVRDRRAPLRRR